MRIEDFKRITNTQKNIPNPKRVDFKSLLEKSEKMDNINSPSHYKLEGLEIESIDIIKARLGKDGFKAFCVGNAMKYLIRAEKKNGIEDYKKAQKYLEWIINVEEV